jgi:hypothetical protein
VPAVAAVIAAGLVATGGFLWWNGHTSDAKQPAGSAKTNATTTLSGNAPASPAVSAHAQPIGPLGLLPFGEVAAPPTKPIGAVRYVKAGDSAYVVMTGSDGVVRYASAGAGQSPHFTDWRPLSGLTAAAEPAVVGRDSGRVEIYAVSSADSQIHRIVLTGGSWSSWTSLAASGVGTIRVAGAPAAVPLADNDRTQLLVASRSGGLLFATGSGAATGSWQPWKYVDNAGSIKPGVALAIRADGTLAAYVIRASDLAILRLINDGSWSYTFPTGAVGQPEAGYTSGGKPYLFIQSVAGDVQVYEPTGANLRGSMTWSPVGVTSQNPVGVSPAAGLGLVLATTSADGTVHLYRTGV